ncbi:LysR family transcriptional regulator [Microbacterium sp. LWO14-1.2]|uniref:LysR family transcriptional regulator n=1 Tax=Microbacterium sp. LWO14-1.2 TaxID=3135263 RepID=UPI00313A27E7
MIDVRKLRLLAALERLGTVTAVAEEVHISSPGVSMQIASLEKEVGVQLTRRQGRRLVLTPAGSALAAHGHEIVNRLSLAELEVEALREGTVGLYKISSFPSAARTIVADAFRRLNDSAAPALELHLTTAEPTESLNALTSGSVDLAVVHSYSNVPRDLPAGIATRKLGSEPVLLAVRSGSGIGPVLELSDFEASSWIAPTSDVSCFEMMERACGLAGFSPRVVAQSMDFAVQLELVAAGVGVALVPALTVAAVPEGVELRRLSEPVRRNLHVATREHEFAEPGFKTLVGLFSETAATWLNPNRLIPDR